MNETEPPTKNRKTAQKSFKLSLKWIILKQMNLKSLFLKVLIFKISKPLYFRKQLHDIFF